VTDRYLLAEVATALRGIARVNSADSVSLESLSPSAQKRYARMAEWVVRQMQWVRSQTGTGSLTLAPEDWQPEP
jgi:hypothetical protein